MQADVARTYNVDGRRHHITACPRRPSSPILQNLIFGTHRDTSNPAADHIHLEPIREVLESDESDVIPCWALDSLESARCGSPNSALSRTAVAYVTLRLNAVWKCDGALMGTSPALPPLATWSTNAAMSRNTSTRFQTVEDEWVFAKVAIAGLAPALLPVSRRTMPSAPPARDALLLYHDSVTQCARGHTHPALERHGGSCGCECRKP